MGFVNTFIRIFQIPKPKYESKFCRAEERIRIVDLIQKANGMIENLDQLLKGILITNEELKGMMGLKGSIFDPQS